MLGWATRTASERAKELLALLDALDLTHEMIKAKPALVHDLAAVA